MTHDDIAELLGAYALGAVPPEEREAVDEHLETCAECAAEADRLQSVSSGLALLVEERDPPPELRTRLLNLVELDRRQWLLQQSSPSAAAEGSIQPRPWWRRVPRLAYGAGASLLVAAIVLALVLISRNSVSVRTYTNVAAAAIIRGVDVRGATVVIAVRSDHTTDMTFSHWPVLPPSLAYEVWLIPAKGNPVPVGHFEATARRSYSMRSQRTAAGYSAVAVSIERAPGDWPSPSPKSVAIAVPLGA